MIKNIFKTTAHFAATSLLIVASVFFLVPGLIAAQTQTQTATGTQTFVSNSSSPLSGQERQLRRKLLRIKSRQLVTRARIKKNILQAKTALRRVKAKRTLVKKRRAARHTATTPTQTQLKP